ncbi:MAG: hypothetical protein QF733_02115 [Phycisphaerales bacterium]|nr:hypothetical protein [Phycisphaerales bacterium]
MSEKRTFRAGVVAAALLAASPLALASGQDGSQEGYEQAIFDLSGIAYVGGPPAVVGTFEVDPDRQIMRLRWEDVVLETYDNTGTPNWASDAYLGILAVDLAGEPLGWLEQPFPTDYAHGVFGPASGSVDLEVANLFTGDDGHVQVLMASSWTDGSGEPAGMYLGGSLILEYLGIPAPGGLALLASLAASRRRRRTAEVLGSPDA